MMEQKNPMEVLTDVELLSEFKMNKNFIDRNAKEMGSRGRPRRFLRMNVERFVAVYFSDQLMESLAKKAEDLRRSELMDALKTPFFQDETVRHIGSGRIMSKGVKQKKVAA